MITEDVIIGEGTTIPHPELVNLYGCTIGKNCRIASFVEIGRGVRIGNNCKIGAFAFIPPDVTIEDDVFIGPHVCFTNDRYPKAVGDWNPEKTHVCHGASIGANSTILCGITVGHDALIGAGSVVTRDVKEKTCVVGNPAHEISKR